MADAKDVCCFRQTFGSIHAIHKSAVGHLAIFICHHLEKGTALVEIDFQTHQILFHLFVLQHVGELLFRDEPIT